jgi:hypothetical protein
VETVDAAVSPKVDANYFALELLQGDWLRVEPYMLLGKVRHSLVLRLLLNKCEHEVLVASVENVVFALPKGLRQLPRVVAQLLT